MSVRDRSSLPVLRLDLKILYLKRIKVSGVWKDGSECPLAGQRAVAYAASREHLLKVPDADQRAV